MADARDGWQVENGAIVLPGGGTYTLKPQPIPLDAITGTRIERHGRWSNDALFCIAVGLGTSALGLVVPDFGLTTFVLGFALIAVGLLIALLTRPVYALIVTSGGANTILTKHTDKATVEAASASLDQLRAQRQ
ncbi:hypothetical protein ABIB57_001703 [Devosia sp. UYZn731]|uniref:DUF6232 family protein n=1 Tax=Devosia sp. UYZn731 TaxID=3156345 RepID=UPI003395C1CC